MLFIDLINRHKLFDSHCHLNDSSFDADRDEVVERAQQNGVEGIIDIGIDINSSKKAVQNSQDYESVYAAVGIDAENLIPGSDLYQEKVFDMGDDEFDKWLKEVQRELESLAKHEKVIMIGETGMDNYWLVKKLESGELSEGDRTKSLDRQEKLFRVHCKISRQLGKPLSIHSRNAISECLRILEEEKVPEQMAVFHSLTPDIEDDEESFYKKVKEILEKKYFIGINGIITFKNADLIINIYKRIIKENSLEALYKAGFIFETDAPFLSPEPKRGERNEPGYLKHVRNVL